MTVTVSYCPGDVPGAAVGPSGSSLSGPGEACCSAVPAFRRSGAWFDRAPYPES